MDRPGVDPDLLREELRALERANRRLGGHQLMLHYVRKLVAETRKPSLSILDLGTGSADVPRAIVDWARRARVSLTVLAVDGNPVVLETAREACQVWPEIRLEQHDLRMLPQAPGSFDLVLCSLTLHHFSNADAVNLLRQIGNIARLGYVLNDLRRNWCAIWVTELFARTIIRSPILQRDAPQSCRAAFTPGELHGMARQAGLKDFQIKRHHAMFRMVLIGRK